MSINNVTVPQRVSPRPILETLTVLRGPAALWVFFYHIAHNTQWISSNFLADIGYVGVSLFFILSGFVLFWSFNPQQGHKYFYTKRVARVYPLHIFYLLLALLLPFVAYPKEIKTFIPNLFLVHSWVPDWNYIFSMNAVSWSLSCEIFFYLIAPFVFRMLSGKNHRVKIILLCLWVAGSGMLGVGLSHISNHADVIAYSNPLIRSGEFLLGILSALLISNLGATRMHNLRYFIPPVILLIVALCFGVSRFDMTQTEKSLIFAVPFALLISLCAKNDIDRYSNNHQSNNRLKQILVYFGNASFAFYLVHELIIINAAQMHSSVASNNTIGAIYVVGVFSISLLFAVLTHQYIEIPTQKYITGLYVRNLGKNK